MKANEAPEKIYLLPRQGGDYAPYWRKDNENEFGVEYTRTDAFIEKAENYLRNKCQRFILTEKDIDDFKKFMKGE
jgi:hypothetical protein